MPDIPGHVETTLERLRRESKDLRERIAAQTTLVEPEEEPFEPPPTQPSTAVAPPRSRLAFPDIGLEEGEALNLDPLSVEFFNEERERQRTRFARGGQAVLRLRPDLFQDTIDPLVALENLLDEAVEDPEAFLNALYKQRRIVFPDATTRALNAADTEALFQAFTDATPEEIKEFFAPNLQRLLQVIFPNEEAEGVLRTAEANPAVFFGLLREAGRTWETQTLLRELGLSWEDIADVFETSQTLMPIDGVTTLVTVLDNGMVMNASGQEIGRIDNTTKEYVPYQYRFGVDEWKSFTAGVGDVIVTAGGTSRWLGAEGIGENLTTFGHELQIQAPPDTLGEFSWQQVFNPRWWSQKVVRSTAFTLSLVPAMIVGSWAGAGVATVLGLGRFGTFVLQALGAGGFSRAIEASLEAGGTFDEAIAKGMTEVEARQAADSVFRNNLALVGVDAAQMAVAFAPTPARVFNGLLTKGWVRASTVGGRLVFTGLTEAGEEAYQEIIQRVALGEEINWNAEMREVVALGGIQGFGFGAGASVYTTIKQRTVAALSVENKATFDAAVVTAIAQGQSQVRADEKGLDAVSDIPEVQDSIAAITRDEEITAFETEVVPSNPQDQLAWDNTVAKMREQAAAPAPVPSIGELETLALQQDAITPAPVTEEELPTRMARFREAHREVRLDVDLTRRTLRARGRADTESRLLNLVLKSTETVLAEEARIVKKIEQEQALTAKEIETLETRVERLKVSQSLLREKATTVAEIKTQLKKVIETTLPLSARGKLLSSLNRVRTQRGLDVATLRVAQVLEETQQRSLKRQIVAELKNIEGRRQAGIERGKFTPESEALLLTVREQVIPTKKGEPKGLTRDQAYDRLEDNNLAFLEGKIDNITLEARNELLNFVGIEDMSSQELQHVLTTIEFIKSTARSERQAAREARKEIIEADVSEAVGIMTGGRGLKDSGVSAPGPPTTIRERIGIQFSRVNAWIFNWHGVMQQLSKFTKVIREGNPLIKKYDELVNLATNAENKGKNEQFEILVNNASRIFKSENIGDLNQTLNAISRDAVELGTFTNTDGKTGDLKMTQDQIVAWYHKLQDPTLDAGIREGNLWTDEMIDALVNYMEAPEQTQLKEFAEWILENYQNYGDTIAPVFEEQYHTLMPRNPNYSPGPRQIDETTATQMEKTLGLDESEHLRMYADGLNYITAANPSLKARVPNTKPFKFDGATSLLINHITQMEHFKAWAEPLRTLRGVLQSRDAKAAIKQYHGEPWNETINYFLNTFARGGIDKAKQSRWWDKRRKNFTIATLGIKPVLALKQIPSVVGYLTQMNVVDVFTGVRDYWRNPVANYRFLLEHSPHFRTRVEAGFERDIRDALQRDDVKLIAKSRNFSDIFMAHIRLGDKFAVTQGMWAKYLSELKKMGANKTDATPAQVEEAIFAAENATRRTQPAFELATLGRIQGESSFWKLFTMFQNQPAQYYRMQAAAIRDIRYRRGNDAQALGTLTLTWVILPAFFQFIADAFQFKKENQLRAWVLGPLNFIPVAGQLFQSIYGWMAGNPFKHQPTPVFATIDDLQRTISQLTRLKNDYGEIDAEEVWELLEIGTKTLGEAFGLPTPWLVQAERSIRGTITEGDLTRLHELFFSPFSLTEPVQADFTLADREAELLGTVVELTDEKRREFEEAGQELTEDFVDMGNLDALYRRRFKNNLPHDIVTDRKASHLLKNWAEKEFVRAVANNLPNVPLFQIVDESSVEVEFLHNLWMDRNKLSKKSDVDKFNDVWDDASRGIWLERGNVTAGQLKLMLDYQASPDREQFLLDNPKLRVNRRTTWYKNNPLANARMAIWGDAKIYTLEAFNEAERLLEAFDIPEQALVEFTLPPDDAVEAHFAYLDAVALRSAGSWEAKLIRLQSPPYEAWLTEVQGLEPVDTPKAALELLVKDRRLYDIEAQVREDQPSIPDPESADYKSGREFIIMELRVENPEWVDNQRRIEALKEGTDEEPTPANIVEGWAERGRIVDENSVGSAEAIIWLVDHPEVFQWAKDNDILHDPEQPWNVDVLRITARWRDATGEYDAIPASNTAARERFRLSHPEWNDDRRRQDAFGFDDPPTAEVVESHVAYGRLVDQHGASSAEVMLYRVDNPTYEAARSDQLTPIDQDQVPVWRIDVKYCTQDAEYDALPVEGDDRENYLAARNVYRQDRRRRDGFQLGVPDNHIENHVTLYEFPDRGFRRERWLSENRDYYNDVWLNEGIVGNAAVDFDKIPDVQADVIYEKWTPQMERYYDEIPDAVRLLTGEEKANTRRRLRNQLFAANPRFFEERILYEAHLAFVPKPALKGYVEYYGALFEGKPDGWDRWWADDRIRRDNPEFEKWLTEVAGLAPRDFTTLPSRNFEVTYNEVFIPLRNRDGTANRQARDDYRGSHKNFDLEGVRAGLWEPHRNRKPDDLAFLAGVVRDLGAR